MKDLNNEYSGEVEEPEHPFSVLVVDDEPYIRAGVKQLLAAQGYQVAMAGSGEQAMTQLSENRYDLLVLDLGMPGVGGAAVLDFVAERCLDMAAIIISGTTSVMEATTALSKGAADYLRKPFGPEELLDCVAKARRTLRQTRVGRRLQKFYDLPFVGMALSSPESKRWMKCNDRLCEILGYPREELVNMTWVEMTHPDDLATNIAEFERVLRGDSEGYTIDKRFIRKDGVVVFTTLNAKCVRHRDGTVDFFITTVDDITERKRVEEALQESEALNATVFNSLTEHVAVLDEQGVIVKVNAAWKRFAEENGVPVLARHSVGLNYRSACLSAVGAFGGAAAASAWAGIEAVLRGTRDHFTLEYPCDAPQVSRWFRMSVYPMAAPRRGVVIAHEDITERKQHDEWLRLCEARYGAIIEGQTDLICRFLPNGILTFVNDAYCHYFGRSREELLGANLMSLIPQEDQAGAAAKLAELNADHPSDINEHWVLRADGAVRWVQWRNRAILDEGQDLIELQSVGHDLTDQRQIEERLRESEEQFRLTFDQSPIGAAIVSLDYRFLRVNDTLCQIIGYSAVELVGMNFLQITHPDDLDTDLAQARQLIAGAIDRYEMDKRYIHKDGSTVWVRLAVRLLRDAAGQALYALPTMQDITERKRMEAELREMSTTDFLTGLSNRRYFMTRMAEELARLQRHDTQRAAVLMFDLDHFKRINDIYGHATGDVTLQHFANLARGDLRKIDTMGRIGGEEFAIILPGADLVAALVFAERLRRKVAETPALMGDQPIPVTVSIGIATMDATDTRVDAALIRADEALYRAKQGGRNQVVAW